VDDEATVTPDALNTLGITLARQSRFEGAAEAFRQAITLQPDFAEAHFNLARALKDLGRVDESIASYRRTLELRPDSAPAWINLANVLSQANRVEASIDAYRQVIKLVPNEPGAHGMLARFLHQSNRIEESIPHFRALAQLLPNDPETHHALGVALHDLNELPQAARSYQNALALDPNHAHAAYGLGLIRLTLADFATGWDLHDARRRLPPPRMVREFPRPLWDGSPLAGKRILIHAEQGLGDTVQFIRFVPGVTQRGGWVIVQCPKPLCRLLEGKLTIRQVIEDGAALPEFDIHCPLLTLPRIFNVNLTSIPSAVPYITPDADLADKWRCRIETAVPRRNLKIGLVWSGSSTHRNDRNRSIPPEMFQTLTRISNASFFSLQKSGSAPSGNLADALIDYTPNLTDLADTAALINNLDLVISVDTAVAHLAGAMAKPVWSLLPFNADWRWMLDRNDSPWYPTMRLFRQPRSGDWQTPLRQIVEYLGAMENRPYRC
jgi:Flp pilus assembly protein TadD